MNTLICWLLDMTLVLVFLSPDQVVEPTALFFCDLISPPVMTSCLFSPDSLLTWQLGGVGNPIALSTWWLLGVTFLLYRDFICKLTCYVLTFHASRKESPEHLQKMLILMETSHYIFINIDTSQFCVIICTQISKLNVNTGMWSL